VISLVARDPEVRRLFLAADLIHADGMPLVFASRLRSPAPLPERVATTDLFHVVARKAEAAGLTFYMFGADEAENEAAVAKVRKMYPKGALINNLVTFRYASCWELWCSSIPHESHEETCSRWRVAHRRL